MLHSTLLDALPGLLHGLSTRREGSVGPPSDPAAAAARAAVVRALGGDPRRLVAPRQVHGARVAVVGAHDAEVGDADGVATALRGVPLLVQGADCPLVALVDSVLPALALVHSGWRGTAARVAARAVGVLTGLGARTDRLHAAVFPGIGPCCFEVGPEVASDFRSAFGGPADAWLAPGPRAGHAFLDLPAAITATLSAAGVAAARVDVLPGCTACGDVLFSHRRSGGAPARHGLFALLTQEPARELARRR